MHISSMKARVVFAILMGTAAVSTILVAFPRAVGQQPALAELEKRFQKQYAAIQKKFADGPEPGRYLRNPDEETFRRMASERRERVRTRESVRSARHSRWQPAPPPSAAHSFRSYPGPY